ncbi:hypothetical protein ABQF26_23880, partial [Mycolicibacterium elephantis]
GGVDTTATRCGVGGVVGEVCADVIGAVADLLDVTSGAGGVGADSAGAATESLGVTVLWRSTSVPGGRSSSSVDGVALNAAVRARGVQSSRDSGEVRRFVVT